MDDLRHRESPLAYDLEAALVPVAVGDDVDRHHEPELAGDLERLEVLPGRHALAMKLEPLLVEGLHAQEHVEEPELLPVREEITVLDEHIAARLEVVLLLDLPSLELLPDREAVLGVDERNVVHEEDIGLADGGQVFGHLQGGRLPVAPAVESPGAAEGAVPRAATGQLGGRARIEHAQEVLVALPRE